MRIGIMCLASFGGSARIATQLALQLARRGHNVHVFSRTTPFGSSARISGIKLHTITSKREAGFHMANLHIDWSKEDLQIFLALILRVIADEGLDILHFHYAVPFAFLAEEVKRRLGNKAPLMVGTLHGTDVSIYGKDPERGPQLAQTLSQIDMLTTVSKSHASLSRTVFGLSSRPKVIPNFIDLSIFKSDFQTTGSLAADEETGIQMRDKPIIAHLSNFRPVKDTKSVARVFLRIREQIDAKLWLIGDGPELNDVRAILQKSRFAEDVHYWGLRHNVAKLLAKTDLLLMTSLSESFCLAALEAMACGVPVLATNVGGLKEVVIHEKTGVLFPVTDHDQAVRRAVSLLSEPAQHQAMRQAAAKRARCYGMDKIIPVYESLYDRLLTPKMSQNSSRIHASSQANQRWRSVSLIRRKRAVE